MEFWLNKFVESVIILLNSLISILIAFLPIFILFIFIIFILDLIKYLKRGIILRRPKIDLKPVNIRVHAKPKSNETNLELEVAKTLKMFEPSNDLFTSYKPSNDNYMSWEEREAYFSDLDDEPIHYEILLNCPNCKIVITDFEAFFCVNCGYQLKKPKAEWIE